MKNLTNKQKNLIGIIIGVILLILTYTINSEASLLLSFAGGWCIGLYGSRLYKNYNE
jgi:hypothetical protein